MTILDEIFIHKRAEIELRKQARPLAEIQAEAAQAPPPLDFVAALRCPRHDVSTAVSPALIAEVKRASPSRGLLAADFDPLRLARIYQENGAAAISVITDERYFKGHLETLRQIAALRPRLPLLRKDFICDPYQLYEARAAGADAALLIVAGLQPGLLRELHTLSSELGMAPLVEVHSLDELQVALACDPILVGINNRDLRDFSVSLDTTLRLRGEIPERICLVAESGIHTPEDVALLAAAGVDAVLVGEALVTASDIGAKVRSLT
jgi:indole-3-glycerol phosphate synthase